MCVVDTHRMSSEFNSPLELPTVRTLEQLRQAFEADSSGSIVFKTIRIRYNGYSNDSILPCEATATPATGTSVYNSPTILSSPLVLLWIQAIASASQEILHHWNESILFNNEFLKSYTPCPPPSPPTNSTLDSTESYYSNLRSWFLTIHISFNKQFELQKEVHAKWNDEQLAIYKKDNAESYTFRLQKLKSLSKALGPYHLKEYQLEAMLAYILKDLPFRIPPFSQNDAIAKKVLEEYASHHTLSVQGAIRVFQVYCSL
jgi:hypothetical protein